MQNILTHTPIYVWAILALLIYRGVIAMREREVPFKKLLIIPAIMIALSVTDIATKSGAPVTTFVPWLAGLALVMLIVCTFGSTQLAPGSKPGLVRVRGSKIPLAMMMGVFVTKYAAAAGTAMQPALAGNVLFVATLCAGIGLFSGYFAGRATRDVMTFIDLHGALSGDDESERVVGGVKA